MYMYIPAKGFSTLTFYKMTIWKYVLTWTRYMIPG